MCGISGAISPGFWVGKSHAENITKRMSDAIAHRGPDGSGCFVDMVNGVTLGHRRLAIIDAEHGHQPMIHSDTGVVLVFNGEIYNFKDLKAELLSLGHRFITESDTEVLLLSYIQWGDKCFERLLGMFSCAIWDPKNSKLVCARDRIGIKPFYFFYDGVNFIFASEIKSISCHPAYKKDINSEGVFDYTRYGYIPGEHTVYKDTYKLTPGSVLTVALKGAGSLAVSKDRYWILTCNNSEVIERPEDSVKIKDKLGSLLETAVSSHMVSDVGVGALLSGGVDSTLVVDLMARTTTAVSVHNVQFGQQEFDESTHAAQVSNQLGVSYTQDNVPSDMCNDIEKIICHFDEPFADASSIAMYYLSKSASERYKVCLSGDGGDELFAGYNWYAELLRFEAMDAKYPRWIRSAVSMASRQILSPSRRGSLLASNLGASPSTRHEALVSVFQRSWAEKLLSDEVLFSLKGPDSALPAPNQISGRHLESPFGDDLITNAQYADLTSYLVDDVLVKVDRMSMAHGLEVRVPLLDHRVVESAFSIPVGMKINSTQRKILLKDLLKDKYGLDFVNRPKQGFSVPLAEWLRKDLFPLVDRYLLISGLTTRSGFFKTSEVKKLWFEFTSGRGRIDLSNNIWLLVCFEVWHNNL